MRKLLSLSIILSFLSVQCFGGGSLLFDRSNDYVNIPGTALSSLGNVFTVLMWVKCNSAALTDTAFGQSNTAGTFVFRVDDDLSISAVITGTIIATTNNSIVKEGVWQHIGYSRSGTGSGTHKIYLSGVSQALTTDSATNYTNTANAKQIGQRGDGASFFGGLIADVRFYNRVLSAGEVIEAMNCIDSPYNGLIGYWPMWDAELQKDLSGLGNNGTNIGGASPSSDGPPTSICHAGGM